MNLFKVWSLSISGLLLLVSCQTTVPSGSHRVSSRPPSNEFRGAWVYDPRRLDPDKVVASLKEAGFNAVFVRLSSAGAAYYPSDVLPKAPGTYEDYAKAYADAGKKYGVKVHAWHVCFMMHQASSSAINVAIKKGEVMRDSKGRALRPTYNVPVRTPALASNRSLERRAVVELVEKYPLDGVQLDYIRYFSPSVDYSATARAAFEKAMGAKVKKWPSDVASGYLKKEYHQWQVDLISSTVREASQAVKEIRPNAQVSAAVWHSPDTGLKDYAQDWVTWVRKGYLDFVVPMNYTSDNHVLNRWVENQKELVNGQIPLYAGLGSYMLDRSDQLNSQIETCRRAGLQGYVLFNYDERLQTRFLSNILN